MMTIHFSADLRQLVGRRIGILHWIADPAVSGFIIAYDIGGNQVLICNVDVQLLKPLVLSEMGIVPRLTC